MLRWAWMSLYNYKHIPQTTQINTAVTKCSLHAGDTQLQSHLYWAIRTHNYCALPLSLWTDTSSTLRHHSFIPNIHHFSYSTQHKLCMCYKTNKINHPVLIQELQFNRNIRAQFLKINFVKLVILLCLFKACCVCISPGCLWQQLQVCSVGIILYSGKRKMIMTRDNWIIPVMYDFWSCCWIQSFNYRFTEQCCQQLRLYSVIS